MSNVSSISFDPAFLLTIFHIHFRVFLFEILFFFTCRSGASPTGKILDPLFRSVVLFAEKLSLVRRS